VSDSFSSVTVRVCQPVFRRGYCTFSE
jgi:hypothetical protein